MVIYYHSKPSLHHPAYTIKFLENEEEGILKKYYSKDSSFATFNGSSTMSGLSDQGINNKSVYWRSNSVNRSNITITLNKKYVLLSSFGMYSCISDKCAYNIDVVGSNDGISWKTICEIRKDKQYFMSKIGYAKCKAKKVYKSIRFVQIGECHNGGYYFTIWYLDLFGKLFDKIPSIITFNQRRSSINSYHLLIILIKK